MQTKTCYKCKRDLPRTREFFAISAKRTDGLTSECHECHREYNKLRYRRHKDSIKKRISANKTKATGVYREIKSKVFCRNCGEHDSCCIDFHHVDPNEKEIAVSAAALYSLNKFLKEAAKCITLCANCHRKYHAGKISLEGLPLGIEEAIAAIEPAP